MSKMSKGFTVIELLVVVLIISMLVVTVFVALNPVERLKAARDSRRWSDVDNILTAVHEYIVDNDGTIPSGITTTEQQLGTAAAGCDASPCNSPPTASGCLDLSSDLAPYLEAIPTDPFGSDSTTNYKIVKDANNLITVSACASEMEDVAVSVSR